MCVNGQAYCLWARLNKKGLAAWESQGKKRIIRTRQKRTLIKYPTPEALSQRKHMWASASNSLVSSLNRLLLFVSSTQSRNPHLLRWWRDRHVPLVPGMHRALCFFRILDSALIRPFSPAAFPCTRARRGLLEPLRAVHGQRWGCTLDKSPIWRRATQNYLLSHSVWWTLQRIPTGLTYTFLHY